MLYALAVAASLIPAPKLAVTPEVAAKLTVLAFQAARDGDLPTLRACLGAGQPVNAVNARGNTLLTVAAYNAQLDAVKLLLKRPGIAVDARNKMGMTALCAAAFKGQDAILAELLAAKADANAASPSGQTALMFAALAGRAGCIKKLIAAGADVRAKDARGNTAASLAEGQGLDARELGLR